MKENDIVIYKGQIGKIVTFDKAFKFKCFLWHLEMNCESQHTEIKNRFKYLKKMIEKDFDIIRLEFHQNLKPYLLELSDWL